MLLKKDLPFVSIIIPVYNGEIYIDGCIKKLLKQTYPKNKLEIIIVDNNSTDKTSEIINKYKVKTINCKKAGPSAARNAGIKASKGEILIFIDIDCLASNNFVYTHVKTHLRLIIDDPNIKIVGGGIKGYNKNYWANCDDFCSWHSFNPDLEPRIEWFHCPTANLSIQREVFNEVGYFNEDMRFGEDVAFCIKYREKKYKLYFEPNAMLVHINRTTLFALIKHGIQWGKGEVLLIKKGLLKFKNSFILFCYYISMLYYFNADVFYYSFKSKHFKIFFYLPFIILNRLIMWNVIMYGIILLSIKKIIRKIFLNKKKSNNVKIYDVEK